MSAQTVREPLIRLSDYQPPAWHVDAIDLEFDLDPALTVVTARLQVRRDERALAGSLELDGEALELIELVVDGRRLHAGEYRIDARGLSIPDLPARAVIQTRSHVRPAVNTALEGLYLSGSAERGFLLTQCEAEGFRRITWSMDRPDVLSRYSVTLRADPERFPVLLAAGNADGNGILADGRHWVRFVDPQPRPSYLFAIAAGFLECIEDAWVTAEGRRVRLLIWAEADAIGQCAHAMECLKAALAWDERRFGRCYQLDVFHVVATHDFTMGAMENTGLNIFNTKYLLADPDHATDDDYRHVLAVVGHEYFHNWTGNRVTCRDWFQLSLKEGLTVYREQEFESDLASRTLRRIEDVRTLWRAQFSEDAGPLAHPVRPVQYTEINNFYTATVYEKGAEIVRMLATLLGTAGFRRGMDLYFERHDGQAVTVEHFLAALGDANDRDLRAWLAWYLQPGTPVLIAEGRYDARARCYELSLRQSAAVDTAAPLPIPVALALFDRSGRALPLYREGGDFPGGLEDVVLLEGRAATFRFREVASEPVPSLLRGYSAPVRLGPVADASALALLATHETDGFNRWFANDALSRLLFAQTLSSGSGDAGAFAAWVNGLRSAFSDTRLDPATLAEMLTLADEASLAEALQDMDPDAVHDARERLHTALACALESELLVCHDALAAAALEGPATAAQARRRLRNRCLILLCQADPQHAARALAHYRNAGTLGDRLVALACLAHADAPAATDLIQAFAAVHAHAPLVLDKWFALQATVARRETLDRVRALTAHPAFRWENPNKVHALLLAFAQRNPFAFHGADGAGYRLVGDAILRLDALTPQVAARLATAFGGWRRLEPSRRELMRAQLLRLQGGGPLSADLDDIVRRSLDGQ